MRDLVHEEALAAGFNAEKEKANLLPPRAEWEGLKPSSGARRPADVWIPSQRSGTGEALDLACCSGLRADLLQHTSQDASMVFSFYEDVKKSYLDTDQQCRDNGFKFTPLVFETHGGGWSTALRNLLHSWNKRQSSAWRASTDSTSLRTAQRISCSLQRENARAVLRRLVPLMGRGPEPGWIADGTDDVNLLE